MHPLQLSKCRTHAGRCDFQLSANSYRMTSTCQSVGNLKWLNYCCTVASTPSRRHQEAERHGHASTATAIELVNQRTNGTAQALCRSEVWIKDQQNPQDQGVLTAGRSECHGLRRFNACHPERYHVRHNNRPHYHNKCERVFRRAMLESSMSFNSLRIGSQNEATRTCNATMWALEWKTLLVEHCTVQSPLLQCVPSDSELQASFSSAYARCPCSRSPSLITARTLHMKVHASRQYHPPVQEHGTAVTAPTSRPDHYAMTRCSICATVCYHLHVEACLSLSMISEHGAAILQTAQ